LPLKRACWKRTAVISREKIHWVPVYRKVHGAGEDGPIISYRLAKAEEAERIEKNRITSEKYGYLTRHFNGNLSLDYDNARKLLINSELTAQQYNYSLVQLNEFKEKKIQILG